MFAVPKNTTDATASPASTGARKPRTIKAEITPHQIILSEGTYPLRNDIREHGFSYNKSDETWRAPYTPQGETYARSIAADVVTTGNVTTQPDAYPVYTLTAGAKATDQPSTLASILPPDVIARAVDQYDADQTPTDQPRRRIKRTADVDQTPAPTQTQSTDIAAALAAFVATVQANQPQPAQPQTPAIDFDAVKQLISAALVPVIERINQRPSTQLTVTTPAHVHTVDGLQHYLLPKLIKALSAKVNVWIAGPSQGGKTTAAKAAAKALGLKFHFHGSMTMAHQLEGFVDGAGHYHETQFVQAFRNGGLVLLDEVDRGSNEALLAMNAPLANRIMSLPNGELIEAHPDFVCIAAANTWGGGATSDYCGAARIDAAFLQRFGARLAWDYDTTLEVAICGNPEWAARVQATRAKARAAGLKVMITPQASISGARLIEAGFTADEAADMTYLADLSPDQRRMVAA